MLFYSVFVFFISLFFPRSRLAQLKHQEEEGDGGDKTVGLPFICNKRLYVQILISIWSTNIARASRLARLMVRSLTHWPRVASRAPSCRACRRPQDRARRCPRRPPHTNEASTQTESLALI